MGLHENRLIELLSKTGHVTERCLPRPSAADILASPHSTEVATIYDRLDGQLSTFPCRPGLWDLELDGVAIELDEYLHFNRYRLQTFQPTVYRHLPKFPLEQYRKMCKHYEPECLKAGSYGGKWTNASCEKQFGCASALGNLEGAGSPRWKQRAFYDFIKDLSPLIINVPVARIAIWDELPGSDGCQTVLDGLNNPSEHVAEQISQLIKSRLD